MTRHSTAFEIERPVPAGDAVKQLLAAEPAGSGDPAPAARQKFNLRKMLMTGAAAAVLAGVVGLSAVLAVQARANLALADKNTALLAANAKIEARYNLAVLGACPSIIPCSRFATGFCWASAWSASAQTSARTIPLNTSRRCRSGAKSSEDCASSISVATRLTPSPILATETCGFPARI
jgi:hypothetical protein